MVLEQALPTHWINEVFDASRQCQYLLELLMSTVVELMLLVTLALRPSLHAAARLVLLAATEAGGQASLAGGCAFWTATICRTARSAWRGSEHRGAAVPGHTLVVYDPDSDLVTDILACEDAHGSERAPRRAVDRRPSLLHRGADVIVHEHAISHPDVLHEQP